MTPTMTVAGIIMKAETIFLTVKDTWTLSTGERETTTREEEAVEGARTEPQSVQTDPEGRVAVNVLWTPALTVRDTTAEDVAPGTAIVWRTSMSEETVEEVEEGDIGAGTS